MGDRISREQFLDGLPYTPRGIREKSSDQTRYRQPEHEGRHRETARELARTKGPRVGWVDRVWARRVGLTDQRLTRAARARVPKPTRRTACTHVSRAMQAARRSAVFDFTSRLGRRAEAGPRRVLPRVRPPEAFYKAEGVEGFLGLVRIATRFL